MITMSDLLRVSLRQVIRQRGFGVIFSIALGITAFITLAVLGREIRYKIGQDMVLMGGVNIINVFANDGHHPKEIGGFTDSTVAALRKLKGVYLISENLQGGKVFNINLKGDLDIPIDFIGVDQYFTEVFSTDTLSGQPLSAEDIKQRKKVCMLGREAAKNLFGSPENAIGKIICLGHEVFRVKAVIAGVMLGSWSYGGFLPYTTMIDRNWVSNMVTRLFVRSIGWEDISNLIQEIPKVIAKYQHLPHLDMRTNQDQLSRIQITFIWVETLLWLGIVASLMLGGFGIWYGTFAAVRARTREVGLKKAMGGADKDILAQFLAEALCKSIAGGALGIVLGIIAVEIGILFLGSSISYNLLLLSSIGSIMFSALIGIAGGLYPAIQASRMDVVTALRFE